MRGALATSLETTVLLLVSVLFLAGCSNFEGTGDLEYVQGDGKIVVIAPENRLDPVEVSGETIQEEPLDFADYRGRVMVVNVWGSWCGPCRKEMPMLVQAEEELPDSDVAFVGIDIRETSRDNGAAFERELGVVYPSLYDPGSETLLAFGKYAPRATPSTLILDHEGRVAVLISGEVPSQQTLTDLVDDVLAETAPGENGDG